MKFAASVSLVALALAGCAANTSSTSPVAEVPATAAEAQSPVAAALPYPQTPEGARQFIADVEKETGWPLRVASELSETAPPSTAELRAVRKYDPKGVWTS